MNHVKQSDGFQTACQSPICRRRFLELDVDAQTEVKAFVIFVFFEGVLVVLGFEAGFIAEGEADVGREQDFGFMVGREVDAAAHAE